MQHTAIVTSWPQGRAVLLRLADWLKRHTMQGERVAITVGEPARSHEQNAKLHAMLTEVSRQVEWAGKRRSVDVWKRLVVAAWLRAEKEPVEMLPALDGHGVDVIFERTSRMSVKQVSSLIEYLYAWGSEHGVQWSAE